MRGKKIAGSFWRTYLFIAIFLIVIYLLVTFREWQTDFSDWFLKTGNWSMLVFITLFGFLVWNIFVKLLQWEFRIQSRPPKERRRFKR